MVRIIAASSDIILLRIFSHIINLIHVINKRFFLLEKNDKELASLAQSARHSTVVHATGSSPLGLYSRHTTQLAASGLSGTTASLSNLAASDIISSRAKFDREAVLPDKPKATNCVV